MVNKVYLGHICTAMMLNELEIIAWCYTIYLILTYDVIKETIKNYGIIRFCNQDELVIACAIFAKVTLSLSLVN